MIPFPSALLGGRAAPLRSSSLTLDFAQGVYTSGTVTAGAISALPGFAFERAGEQGAVASDGSVSYFAANVPAINDRGYHAYGALTNLNIRSNEHDTWTSNVGLSSSANTIAGPDGLVTADTITGPSANGMKYTYHLTTATFTAATHSNVQILKMGTQRFVQLIFPNVANNTAYANFDLQLVTKTAEGGGGTGYITALAGGWFLCVLVAPTLAVSGVPIGPVFIDNGAVGRLADHTGGSTTLHIAHVQHLLGSLPDGGPLIRTGAATASIGASDFRVGLANGNYTGTFTFDDGSSQILPITVADGLFRHPMAGTLNRPIVRTTSVVAA